MISYPDQFTDRIKAVINRLDSVANTARIIGVSEGTVRSWRDGNSDPQRKHIVELSKAADVSIAWLAAGEGSMEASIVGQVKDWGSGYQAERNDYYLRAIHVIEALLQERRVNLLPEKKVQLVKLVADMIENKGAEKSVESVKDKISDLILLAS